MAKYDPLNGHLLRQRPAELEMSFAEIERVIGSMLPKSAERPQWWGNEGADTKQVQCAAWGGAGYDASLVTGRDRVRFARRR